MSIYKTVIDSKSRRNLFNFKELNEYKDLFKFLIWRNIRVRYAQSVLGVGWAVLQPLFSMVVFTIIFGNLAKIDSNGVPYAIFSFTALVPWTYFSNALLEGTNSLVQNANIISKVYFPRIMLPLSSVASKLIDFVISFIILILMMFWFQVLPTAGVFLLPVLIFMMILTATGISLWLTALAIQYRDIRYAMNFIVQLLMYAAPVVYPTTLIPEHLRLLYALNPLVGVIEGFRSILLGTIPLPLDFLIIGFISSSLILITGFVYFRRKERLFADVA